MPKTIATPPTVAQLRAVETAIQWLRCGREDDPVDRVGALVALFDALDDAGIVDAILAGIDETIADMEQPL